MDAVFVRQVTRAGLTSNRAARWVFYGLWVLSFGLVTPATVLAQPQPELASVATMAVDLHTGEVLVEKRAHTPLAIASITKLMTALVVLESQADLQAWITFEDWDQATEKNAYSRIRVGSQAKREDLLRIALMSSENRAAYNLAVAHPGGLEQFVASMNAKAEALGMKDTRFVDPTGLSPQNVSTAADLVRLLVAAREQPLLQELSTTSQHTVRFRAPRYQLGYGNTNPLVRSSRWDVGLTKTGYLTEAGRCLVMLAKVADRELALVMLNSFGTRSPLGDAGRIRRFLQSGVQGSVARAAREYEKTTVQRLGLTPKH